jgi:hypothetical protein
MLRLTMDRSHIGVAAIDGGSSERLLQSICAFPTAAA